MYLSFAMFAATTGIVTQGFPLSATSQAPSISGFEDATIHPSTGGLAICVSGMVPVAANTTRNVKLNLEMPKNQTQATEIFVQAVTDGSSFSRDVKGEPQSIGGLFHISSTLCVPASGSNHTIVQFLTHGVGFDKRYWDFAPGYSYVDAAVKHGYAVFFYDRLGVGQSSKEDGINVVQAPLEIEIAHKLVAMLREGRLSNTAFTKVVGTGHSYGSAITQAFTAEYPHALDAAVLTGFSANGSGLVLGTTSNNYALANQNQPKRFSHLPNSYVVCDTEISIQTGFFRAPNFDPAILTLAEATKGTTTFGEQLNTGGLINTAPGFTKPLAIVNGANDLVFCFGNCSYPTDKGAAVRPALYPNLPAHKFGTYLAPDTGHGLNLHYTAEAAYEWIQTFLKNQDL